MHVNPARVPARRLGYPNFATHIARAARALVYPARLLQHPLIGSLVFVGLIYFWLTPAAHFDAMPDHHLYLLMMIGTTMRRF